MAILRGPVNPKASGVTSFPDLKSVQVTAPNRHSVQPALVLDFVNNHTLDPRVSFTRGSSATFYDGTTVLGDHNFFTQSQDITDSVWEKSNCSAAGNTTTAPDGTVTADTLTKTSNSSSRLNQIVGSTTFFRTGQRYSISAYVKNINATHVFLGPNTWDGVGGAVAEFSFSSNAVSRTAVFGNWIINSTSMTAERNGFYRIAMTFTVMNTSAVYTHRVHIGFGDGTTSIASDAQIVNNTGNGHSFYIWGTQLELNPSTANYTPTTTAPVFRYYPALKTAGPNQPRFDVNPLTGESRGLLVEEQRTNFINLSTVGSIGNSWQQYNTAILTANYTTAPDGSITAGRITTTSEGTVRIVSGTALSNGTTYAASIWVKSNTSSNYTLQLQVGDGNVASITATPTWQRFSGSGTPVQTGYNFIDLETIQAGADISVWGAQLEQAAFASSYIPTTGSGATRSPDLAEISGQNFLNFFNQTAGTFFFEGSINGYAAQLQGGFAATRDTGNDNVIDLRVRQSGFGALHVTYGYGSNQALLFNNADLPINTVAKFSLAYASNDIAFYKDGVLVGTDNTVNLPNSLTKLEVGKADNSTTKVLNGYVRKLSYYPVRLTNDEMVGLTTA